MKNTPLAHENVVHLSKETTPDRFFLGGGGHRYRTAPALETGSLLFKKNGKRYQFFFPDLTDVYTGSIWEFVQEMHYKTPKKEEHGYHFGTVNVLPKNKEHLTEIEKWYVDVCDGV